MLTKIVNNFMSSIQDPLSGVFFTPSDPCFRYRADPQTHIDIVGIYHKENMKYTYVDLEVRGLSFDAGILNYFNVKVNKITEKAS